MELSQLVVANELRPERTFRLKKVTDRGLVRT